MLCAEISESRMATKARPVGERSRFRMASVHSTATQQAHAGRSSSLEPSSQPNSVGDFTCSPELPPVTLSQRANTSSTMKPKASVAMPR